MYENGACFSPEVLDITSEDLLKYFVEVISKVRVALVVTMEPFI